MTTPAPGAGLTDRLRAIDHQLKIVFGAVLLLGTAYGATTSVLAIHLDARSIGKTEGAVKQLQARAIAALARKLMPGTVE